MGCCNASLGEHVPYGEKVDYVDGIQQIHRQTRATSLYDTCPPAFSRKMAVHCSHRALMHNICTIRRWNNSGTACPPRIELPLTWLQRINYAKPYKLHLQAIPTIQVAFTSNTGLQLSYSTSVDRPIVGDLEGPYTCTTRHQATVLLANSNLLPTPDNIAWH